MRYGFVQQRRFGQRQSVMHPVAVGFLQALAPEQRRLVGGMRCDHLGQLRLRRLHDLCRGLAHQPVQRGQIRGQPLRRGAGHQRQGHWPRFLPDLTHHFWPQGWRLFDQGNLKRAIRRSDQHAAARVYSGGVAGRQYIRQPRNTCAIAVIGCGVGVNAVMVGVARPPHGDGEPRSLGQRQGQFGGPHPRFFQRQCQHSRALLPAAKGQATKPGFSMISQPCERSGQRARSRSRTASGQPRKTAPYRRDRSGFRTAHSPPRWESGCRASCRGCHP